MLLVKWWWDVCTEFIVRIRNWRHQFQLEMENRRRQLKEPYGGKDLVSARWVLLTGFEEVSSPNGLFYSPEERKEIIYHAACVCLLSAVWPQMPTTQATFYQWPDCWRRFLVLLVIDVIKPLPMFFCMLCWIQFDIQQSVLNFSQTNIACKLQRPAPFLQQMM